MRADAHCAMIVTNGLKVVGETTEAEDACGSTSRAQSIATACHRCLDVAPGEIESEPLSHLLAVSHSAATLDPRRSPKTSPNHTAAGAVKPHHKLMLLQEEARRAHVAAKQLQHKHNDTLLRGGAAEKVGHEGPTDGRPAYASRSPRSVRAHSHNRASTPPRCHGQYVRAGEEDAYELGEDEVEEKDVEVSQQSVEDSPTMVVAAAACRGGQSLREEFHAVMEEMAGPGQGIVAAEEGLEHEQMDEADREYAEMLRQVGLQNAAACLPC